MFKTGCLTCKHEMGCGTPCFERVDGVMVFHRHENSDMYKAYLAEKERADKAETKARDYKFALICGCCGGTGIESTINGVKTICTDCVEIRKEARGGEVE